jgi:hypothetical protein
MQHNLPASSRSSARMTWGEARHYRGYGQDIAGSCGEPPCCSAGRARQYAGCAGASIRIETSSTLIPSPCHAPSLATHVKHGLVRTNLVPLEDQIITAAHGKTKAFAWRPLTSHVKAHHEGAAPQGLGAETWTSASTVSCYLQALTHILLQHFPPRTGEFCVQLGQFALTSRRVRPVVRTTFAPH